MLPLPDLILEKVKYARYGRYLLIRKSNTFVGSSWIIQPELLIERLRDKDLLLLGKTT